MISFTSVIALDNLSCELHRNILSFCSHVELCRLSTANRYFARECRRDKVWKALFSKTGQIELENVPKAMSIFGLTSFAQLFQVTYKLQLPCGMIGLWRAENYVDDEFNGELLCINPIQGGIMCSSVHGDNSEKELFCIRVKPTKTEVKVIFFNLEHCLEPFALTSITGTAGSGKIGLKRSKDGFTLTRAGKARQYVKVISPSKTLPDSTRFFQPNSLWGAYYKSITKEIVQITYQKEEVDGKFVEAICGTKIIGDPNVPSGCVSFVLDPNTEYNVFDEMAKYRSEMCLKFEAGRPYMFDLTNLQPHLRHWIKGKIQMNPCKDTWEPVWLDIDCLVYSVGSEMGFCLLWTEPLHGMNIVINFSKIENFSDAQWSLDMPLNSVDLEL